MSSEDAAKQRQKRSNIVKEIMETEEFYVNQLNVMVELYIQPLSTKSKIIPLEDIDNIFSNIEQIRNVNVSFLDSLRQAVGNGPDYSRAIIGQPFLELGPFFKVYLDYVGNQELSNKTLLSHAKSSSWKKFCKNNEDNPRSNGLDLDSLLICPVQRIPRYKLLLDTLLKNTPKNHPDSELIPQALEQIGSIADLVNKAARETAEYLALIDIQKLFRDGAKANIAVFGRKLVRKGLMKKICRSADKEYTFFLFNDMMVYCTGGGVTKFSIHARMPINKKFSIRDLPDSENYRNMIQLSSSTKSFVVFTSDSTAKYEWLADLQKLIDNVDEIQALASVVVDLDDPNGGVPDDEDDFIPPVYIPDTQAEQCELCGESFSIVRRKHHCRRCGKLICGPCSKNKMMIRKKSKRICDQCFDSSQTSGPRATDAKGFKQPIFDDDNVTIVGGPTKEDEDSEDELFSTESWFEVVVNFKGDPSEQLMDLKKGHTVAIQHRDQSGWCFGINLDTREVGWIDPGMIKKIHLRNEDHQKELETTLRNAITSYVEDSKEPSNYPAKPQTNSYQPKPPAPTNGFKPHPPATQSPKINGVVKPNNQYKPAPPTVKPPTPFTPQKPSNPSPPAIGNQPVGMFLPRQPEETTITSKPFSSSAGGPVRGPILPLGVKVVDAPAPIGFVRSANSTDFSRVSNESMDSKASDDTASVKTTRSAPTTKTYKNTPNANPVKPVVGFSGDARPVKSNITTPPAISVVGFGVDDSGPSSAPSGSNFSYNGMVSSPTVPATIGTPAANPTGASNGRPEKPKKQIGFTGRDTTTVGQYTKALPLYRVVKKAPGNDATEELELVVGDVITITLQEKGWWYGESKKLSKAGWIDPKFLEPI